MPSAPCSSTRLRLSTAATRGTTPALTTASTLCWPDPAAAGAPGPKPPAAQRPTLVTGRWGPGACTAPRDYWSCSTRPAVRTRWTVESSFGGLGGDGDNLFVSQSGTSTAVLVCPFEYLSSIQTSVARMADENTWM